MVSKNIKTFRVVLSLDQHDFAKCIGVTQPTISSWENGKSEPIISHFLVMVEMGASIDFLLFGRGSPLQRVSA